MINHQEYHVYDKDKQAYLTDAAFMVSIKDGAYFCSCAHVLRIT